MAVTSQASLSLVASGDVNITELAPTVANTVGAGKVDLVTLALGTNTITVPAIGTVVPKGVILVPPAGNTQLLTLKGVAGDTGVKLHLTEPSYISLDSTVVNFVINAATQVVGVRLIWN